MEAVFKKLDLYKLVLQITKGQQLAIPHLRHQYNPYKYRNILIRCDPLAHGNSLHSELRCLIGRIPDTMTFYKKWEWESSRHRGAFPVLPVCSDFNTPFSCNIFTLL